MRTWFRKITVLFATLVLSAAAYAGEVQHIDNEKLKLLTQQNVPLVDVRATSEWQETGVVEGSHLLMFYNEQGIYNLEKWLADLEVIAEKGQPIVLICHSGSRSKQLAKYLTKVVGYEKVYNVKKGIRRWVKENNPTVLPQ